MIETCKSCYWTASDHDHVIGRYTDLNLKVGDISIMIQGLSVSCLIARLSFYALYEIFFFIKYENVHLGPICVL